MGIGDNLLLVIGLGVLCSLFPIIAGVLYANFIGKKVKADDEAAAGETAKTYEELVAAYGKLPNGCNALAPIIVPIILMAASSIVAMAKMTGAFANLLTFLGTPIIALAVGTLLAVLQLKLAGKINKFYELTNETLKTVGHILFVTAAGGVLGKVIASSDMVNYIKDHATVLSGIGCMRALGVRFLDCNGNELSGIGSDLEKITDIDTEGLDKRIGNTSFTVMCDVTNPLCGKDGATYTFGRQKGATAEIQDRLEKGMRNYRDIIIKKFGINPDFGKVVQGVGDRCKRKGVPALALVGSMGKDADKIFEHGICSMLPTVVDTISLEEALSHAKEAYYDGALRLFRFIKTGMEIKSRKEPN